MKIINKSGIQGLKMVGSFMTDYWKKKNVQTVHLLGVKKSSLTSCGYALHYKVFYKKPEPRTDLCDASYTNTKIKPKRGGK